MSITQQRTPRWLHPIGGAAHVAPFVLVLALGPGCSGPSAGPAAGGSRGPSGQLPVNLGPYVPTPQPIVERMLQFASVGPGDKVYDLGCGDGRIVIAAAQLHGAHAVGIEYDVDLCAEAREKARAAGVEDLVEIREGDILQSDFSDATAVMIYLLPESNLRLRPRLEVLAPGTRIVAHDYPIGDWEPSETLVLSVPGEPFQHLLRLYVVPERKGKAPR